ncbi:MAG: MFS transporter [Deltaproteobacteria bacterium]|nr:MAG: MFS transporter [Deltaproteobacteria bacterium]
MSRRSPLLPIFLIVLVDILGLTIILPLLPFYAERFGASPFVVGLLITSYAACQLVSGPILGRISDRVGRRPMLLVSQTGTFGGFLLMAFAQSLPLLFVARIIDGITAGNLSLAQAYVSDVTRPEDRARSFGIIGIAFGIGFLVGPAVSGYLSQFGLHVPVFAAAGLSLTSIVATYTLLPSGPPPAPAGDGGDAGPGGRRLGVLEWRAYADYFRRPELARLLAQFFAFVFAFSTFTSGFALFCERRFTWHGAPFGAREVGYVFAYVGFLGIILQGKLLGPMVTRFGEARLIVAGFFAAAIAYAGLGLAHGVTALGVVATISAFGNGVLRPAITSRITQAVGRHEQGVVLGLTQSLSSVSMIVAPLVGNALIEFGHLTAWAFVAAAFVSAGFALAARERAAAAAA